MTNGKHGISFARRLRTALALIADIRGKDCLTAVEFMKLVYPNQRPLIQALKFAGWSLNLVWSKMPDALRHVTIDRNISKTPYWQTAPNPLANHPWADSPDAALPTEADAVVIGAGFGGSSVAYHWSKQADGNLVILDSMDPRERVGGPKRRSRGNGWRRVPRLLCLPIGAQIPPGNPSRNSPRTNVRRSPVSSRTFTCARYTPATS